MSDTPSGTPSDGRDTGPLDSDTGGGGHQADTSQGQQYPPPGQQYPPPGQQQYQQPGQQYAPGGQYGGQYGYGGPPPQQQGNGFAVAGMVLGILAVLFAFIPFLGVVFGVLLGVLGAIFGGLGIARAGQPGRGGRGMAIAGLVLGIIGLVLALAQGAILGNAADELNRDIENEFGEFGEFEQ